MAFEKAAYDTSFKSSIKELAKAEKITRAVLLDLSRSVLEAFHATQDVYYLNEITKVLTPVNRKVAVLYFKAFSGFMYNEEEQIFTKKDKKNYDAVQIKAMEFLEDPLNNIWSWAQRNVEIEPKEFTIERMKKQFESTLKKAQDNGINELQVIETMMEAGLKMDTLIALMAKIAGEPAVDNNEPEADKVA